MKQFGGSRNKKHSLAVSLKGPPEFCPKLQNFAHYVIIWLFLIFFDWIMLNMVNNEIIWKSIEKKIILWQVNMRFTFTLQYGLNGDLCKIAILFGLKSMSLNGKKINFVLVCILYCYNKYKKLTF